MTWTLQESTDMPAVLWDDGAKWKIKRLLEFYVLGNMNVSQSNTSDSWDISITTKHVKLMLVIDEKSKKSQEDSSSGHFGYLSIQSVLSDLWPSCCAAGKVDDH